MKYPMRFLCSLLLLLLFVMPALAGPPLVCHRFEIGDAKSLPWGNSWNLTGTENYDTKNLVRDTLAILDSNTPVLVRMETLRRATLYARQDLQTAKELLTRLHARAVSAETAGHPDALAWFDLGYLAATYDQGMPLNMGANKPEPNPAAGLDAYNMVKRALALRGNDPQMEFAAALVTLRGPEKEHQEHVQKAMAGGKTDPLLARNFAIRFLGNKETVSQALLDSLTPGAAK